ASPCELAFSCGAEQIGAVGDAIKLLRARAGGALQLPGERSFLVYDTHGLDRGFIQDFLRDLKVCADWVGFDRAMEEQRTKARAFWKGAHKEAAAPVYLQIASVFRTESDFYFGFHV